MPDPTPEFMLFVQHGWADDNRAMTALAETLVEDGLIVAPNLGYIQTWLRISPLIQKVAAVTAEHVDRYPGVPIKLVGHSMGGLIWLEVLNLHPEWWTQIHSLVLVASPVGGADLGRIIDPFGLGIGIAADLGMNRKPIAEAIAAVIPTLVIAGDSDGDSDGTITIESTRFQNAHYTCLPGLSHPAMRNHPQVTAAIQQFWADVNYFDPIKYDNIVRQLQAVPGITDGHRRDFVRARVVTQLENGGTIRTWKNLLGVDHVFVASADGRCLYAGFVGWQHRQSLQKTLAEIAQDYGAKSLTP